MSFNNPVVSNQYSGNGVDVTFNITFDFLVGEDQIKVKVYNLYGTLYTEESPTPNFTIDEGTLQVTFDVAPAANQVVVIYREVAPAQEVEYLDYRFPYQTIERHFDRVFLLLQEHDKMLETGFLKDYYNPNGNDPNGGSFSGYNIVGHQNGAFPSSTGDLIYLPHPSNAVTVQLPDTPDEGDEVVVKEASGVIANKTIDGNGNTIVGVGATYALQSEYETVRLVYSAAGWLII